MAWQNPTQSDRHWQSTVIMANQASPHLAFQLVHRCTAAALVSLLTTPLHPLRFHTVDTVTKEVTRLIQCNPVAFVDISDAALVNVCLSFCSSVCLSVSLFV